MFVPVPVAAFSRNRKNIINETIVYSDTVLPVKDLGNNIKVTSIFNINENQLEECLNIIFESNPNVIFNTIQYSREKKKVYFYTNDKISTKEWLESNEIKRSAVKCPNLLLEELKRVLTAEKNKNPDVISLFDLYNLIKRNYDNYKNMIKYYEQHLTSIVASKIFYKSEIKFKKVDYNKKELTISFDYMGYYIWSDISFSKSNDDLYISKYGAYGDEVLLALGNELSKFYDCLMEFSSFNEEYVHWKKLAYSNFEVSISNYGVEIDYSSPNYTTIFELRKNCFASDYKYRCNSNIILSAFKGQEDEIFKRLFVKISDCPKWSQSKLYEIRKNQLEEEQRLEEEMKQQEIKRQKRLALKRKIFPFLYK